MSYTLVIGRAHFENDEEGPRWRALESEGPTPHSDQWEAPPYLGEAVRCPGYSQWHDVLNACPPFRKLWENLEHHAVANGLEVIPVGDYYHDLLDVERAAVECPEDVRARILWFTRWSRHALTLYGEGACFETPGEWCIKQRAQEGE